MSDYDMSIHRNPDAMAWAKLFIHTWEEIGRPQPTEDWMHGWFANAMMAMHDYLLPHKAPLVLPDGSAVFVASVSCAETVRDHAAPAEETPQTIDTDMKKGPLE